MTERIRSGREAESLAARYLRGQGYRIVAQNYRIQQGEIDIVAEDGQYLCFVEVRSRQHDRHGHPAETVNHAKRKRLVRAARHYLATHAKWNCWVRFDVVAITRQPPRIELFKDAFQLDGSPWGASY